jgi:hypothetical protein
MRKRILLGHLNSNGDCLFATVVARQIKEIDYPGCELTWAVNSRCKQSVELNPYVDHIMEIPTRASLTSVNEWKAFARDIEDKKDRKEFDLVFLTQIFGENWYNYDGGIRSSIYNNYQRKIIVPHQPIIELSDAEIQNVKDFAQTHRLGGYKRVVLIECGADSFETALHPLSARDMISDLTGDYRDTAFILSSTTKMVSDKENIIDASVLTFRENAELSKYCDLFVGCSSGISWLMTTNWAKKLNMVLVIAADHVPFSSMRYDHEYLGLPTDHIIELRSDSDALTKLKRCLVEIFNGEFAAARRNFDEDIVLDDYSFLSDQVRASLTDFEFGKALGCVKRCIKRNGRRFVFSSHFPRLVAGTAVLAIKKMMGKSDLNEGS